MRTSAGRITAGEPLTKWVTEDSKCLNKNHALYEKQFSLSIILRTHVFCFCNNTVLLEKKSYLVFCTQRSSAVLEKLAADGLIKKEFPVNYRIRTGRPDSVSWPVQDLWWIHSH
jgi:hypothetical protein